MDTKSDKPADVESPRGHNPLYVESTDNNVPALFAAHNGGGEAIHAHNRSTNMAAVAAFNLNPNSTAATIFAKKEGSSGHAGFFVGNVWVERDLGVKGTVHSDNSLRTKGGVYADGGLVGRGVLCKEHMEVKGNLLVRGRITEIGGVVADDSLSESESKSESLLERIRRLEAEVADLRSRLK
jgi:hypothetical protein